MTGIEANLLLFDTFSKFNLERPKSLDPDLDRENPNKREIPLTLSRALSFLLSKMESSGLRRIEENLVINSAPVEFFPIHLYELERSPLNLTCLETGIDELSFEGESRSSKFISEWVVS